MRAALATNWDDIKAFDRGNQGANGGLIALLHVGTQVVGELPTPERFDSRSVPRRAPPPYGYGTTD